ncbi:MAG TPA: hypothetical protein VM370_09760 [Candidatus Thermoplasmatota archaeon]|nr:hypothetical protein [Candidatus Thermoplasmatota archaeon]
MQRTLLLAATVVALALAGCAQPAPSTEPPASTPSSSPTPSQTPSATSPAPTSAPPTTPATSSPTPPSPQGQAPSYATVKDSDFVAGRTIDNPFLPMPHGATWTFRGHEDDEDTRIEVRVLDELRTVNGVQATVLRDTEYDEDDEILEDTYDWFAQDKDGNVWYLGEATTAYEDGGTSHDGSWEWGVDGAQAGIVMWAHPAVTGEPYFQEHYPGHAMDQGQVLALGESVTVPTGTYQDTVETRETNALEPGHEETAWYVRGIGVVLKESKDGSREELLASSLVSPAS